MRKGILAGTCTLGTSAALGFALWAGAAFGQETTTPGAGNPKPGVVTRAEPPRPGFFQRLFRRPQTQSSVAPSQTPAPPLGAPTAGQKGPIRPVGASAQHVPIPEVPALPQAHPTLPQANLKMPQGNPTVAQGNLTVVQSNPLDVSGHDENYTWITGVLTRKPGLPNVWFITYLPPDAIPDLHRGCVAVQSNHSMKDFREGDLVTVIGYIITNVEVAPGQRVTGFAAEQVNPVK